MPSCEYAYHVESYVERRLHGRALAILELHLLACEHCQIAVEFELLVRSAIDDHARSARFSRSWH